jgi:hypothetical protein
MTTKTPKIPKILKILLILGILVQTISCTHWIIDTETRIQMQNKTDEEISNLSIISEDGKIMVLAPEASKVYEHELVGKFNFIVYAGGVQKDLGTHELKGGSTVAIITKDGENFKMNLK